MQDEKGRFMKGQKAPNWNGFKKGQTAPRKGKHNSSEHNLKLSKALKGRVSPRKGVNLTEETKRRISAFQQGKSVEEWNGYKSSQDKLQRAEFRKTMQKDVLERDNYTCQLCEIQGVALQVDHIQPWADYVELRFSMDNCRTLCMDCHYLITFGKPKPKSIKTWGHNLGKAVE